MKSYMGKVERRSHGVVWRKLGKGTANVNVKSRADEMTRSRDKHNQHGQPQAIHPKYTPTGQPLPSSSPVFGSITFLSISLQRLPGVDLQHTICVR